ncbi:hypothetical protein [Actinoplanes sp. NPDC051494]|uniref:hypothetical protein n=1 Tax=Actinoplanes sp. NPDC051494 TaxID=3363907 RepID=UPI00379F25E2
MTRPIGQLWVNPDGVIATGEAYEQQVQLYERYVEQLTLLRERYGKAWGDDDMGKAFSDKFLKGLDNLDSLIGGVKGTLNYTAEGLRESGKMYRDVDEGAREAGEKMARDFEEDLSGPPLALRSVNASETTGFQSDELTPLQPAYAVERARITPALRVEGEQLFMKSERREAEAFAEPLQPTTSMQYGIRARGELLTPQQEGTPAEPMHRLEPARATEPLSPLMPAYASMPASITPAMPAISSYMATSEYATAYVGGQPLPQGYQLQALNTFEDGTARIDANMYESVTPLAGTPVTTPDGRPLDPEGRQFFVVKDNPAVNPAAPGYQPLVISYSADGTPVPLV